MKKFLIRTNESKDEKLEFTHQLADKIVKLGGSADIELMDDFRIRNEGSAPNPKTGYECVLVLGGDGTMLRAARDYVDTGILLCGINLGTVGYLTEVDSENVDTAIERLMRDDYMVQERMMLEGEAQNSEGTFGKFHALNDIVVSKSGSFQAINFDIYVNGRFLKNYSADGVIVSTPTGSTGYNLSAGGPIVEPDSNIVVLTPVSPHTLISRSIVLSGKDEIKIVIAKGKNGGVQSAVAMADAQTHFDLESDDSIEIRRSANKVKFAKLNSTSFLDTLKGKLQ